MTPVNYFSRAYFVNTLNGFHTSQMAYFYPKCSLNSVLLSTMFLMMTQIKAIQ